MKKILLLLAFCVAPLMLPSEAAAQSCEVVPATPGAGSFPAGSHINLKCLQTGELVTSAAVSATASIAGFPTSQTTGTPISSTTTTGTGTLPAGAVVVATNVGTTNGAYCKLGASATTSDQFIAPNGGWFAFTVGSATQLTCITSTSTTTVNMVGGSGLPTGTGGGGGGSGGGGGAITAASGAYASGSIGSGAMVDLGAVADAAATAGGTGTLSAKLRLMTTQLGTLNTTLGTPMQATGGTVTANIGTAGTLATAAKQPALGTAGTASTDVLTVQGVAAMTPLLATLSGTNNINNISGTVSLPTGAATAANQTNASQKTQIVDGSGNVIASTSNNLNVQCANCSGSGVSTGDEATFTAGTSLFAGTGGFFQTTATANALTNGQQGMLQMTANRAAFTNLRNAAGTEVGTSTTPLQTTGANGTFPVTNTGTFAVQNTANATTNISQINGVTPLMGNGVTGTGSQRVTIASDNTAFAVNAAATQSGTWNVTNISGTVSLPTGASTAAKQPALGTAGSASTDVLSVQGIASMTPFLANPGTAANWGVGTSTQNSATVANGQLGLAQFNTTPTTITSGNMSPLQMDNAGNLLVNIKAGSSSGAVAQGSTTSGQTGGLTQCAVTTSAPTYTTAQTDPLSCDTGGSLRVNATNTNANGQATMANSSPVVIASNQSAISVTPTWFAQGSTTSGQSGDLNMGAVTTAAPTYTTAQTSPLSLTTGGGLRADTASIAGTATATGSGTMNAGTQRIAIASDSPGITTLGQTTKSASVPVTMASDQGSLGALSSQYPSGAIPETVSATGTTAATTATLATAVGKTTYICGFAIRANATAAATGTATVTGTITATMSFVQWTAPLASGIGLVEQRFAPCVPASTTNTSIAVVSAAPGSGGTVSVAAWGYQL